MLSVEDNFDFFEKYPTYLIWNLYTDRTEFMNEFKNHLINEGVIVQEINLLSDIYQNNPIKMLIIKLKEDDFRIIQEIKPEYNLSLL